MEKKLRQAVMAVFVNNKDQVLIGSSPRDGGFKFPQGGIDVGEIPKQTLIRELKEELGIDLDENLIEKEFEEKVVYLFSDELVKTRDFLGQQQIVFKIKYDPKLIFQPQDDEFDKLIWIYPENLKKYDTLHRFPAYKRALELCGFFNI